MSKIHQVPMVRQHTSPVCWLACAMMLKQYKNHRTLDTYEMGYVVMGETGLIEADPRIESIHNISSNFSVADSYETFRMLRNFGFQIRHVDDIPLPRSVLRRIREMRHSPTSLNATPRPRDQQRDEVRREISALRNPTKLQIMINILQMFGPFILFHHCGSFWYGRNAQAPNSGAHAVLITGIDTSRGLVYFNNPWGQTNVSTSISSILGAVNRWGAYPFAYLR